MELSQTEIVRAATNDPELAPVSFTLGDRTFKVLDLEYDSYITFLAKLEPLLKALANQFTGVQYDYVGDAKLNVTDLFKYCAEAIPEMATIVCRATDPDITVDEVKKLGKNPFKLAAVVLKQIEQNRIIADIASFFAQILPLLRVGRTMMTTPEETPSS
jgi:hypothetical protein